MAEFYRIQIGSIHLTKTGGAESASNLPCLLEIENLEDLQVSIAGNSTVTASGSRIRQSVEWQSGKEFSLQISTLMAGVYEDIKNFLNDANENDTSFTIIGTGDSGNFSVTAKPSLQKPFACAGFINGRILNVVLRFET